MKAENMKRADFVMSIGLIAFGIFVLIMALQMPTHVELQGEPYSGPGVVPGFLGITLTILGVVLMIRSIIHKGYKVNINKETIAAFFKDASTKRLGLTLVICLGYAFGILDRIPYLAATIIFIFVFVVAFEFKRGEKLQAQAKMFGLALLLAGIAGTATWATFRYAFLVNLPG